MHRKIPDRQKLPRNRYQPHRIVTTLLWHDFEWAVWVGPCTVQVRTGPMARVLKLTSSRLREHFDWLVAHSYLKYCFTDHGKAILEFNQPLHCRGPVEAAIPSRIDDQGRASVTISLTKEQAAAGFIDLATSTGNSIEVDAAVQKAVDKKKDLW